MPQPKATVWLATQDPHGSYVAGMVNEELPGSTFHDRLLYQSLDLPWPLVTRQWVIRVKNNRALLDATGDAVWERTWDLSPARGAAAERPNAVWLDVNDGGWVFADAPGGTLLAYHVRSVIGGNVPDDVATRYVLGTLEGMLESLVSRSSWMVGHYTAGHAPIVAPDDRPVPVF